MTSDELLQHLKKLEIELHQPSVRTNVKRLDDLLHDSFAEIGRSGRTYSKADILAELPLMTCVCQIVLRLSSAVTSLAEL